MEYAIIENGIVVNLILLLESNATDFPDAVPTHGLTIQVGDHYDQNEEFSRNGSKILSAVAQLQTEAAELINLLGEVVQTEYTSAMEEIYNV